MNYEIVLTYNEFQKILDDSKYDLKTLKVKNVSAISLTQAFEKRMQEFEKVNVKVQGRIGRFHLEPVRGVTPHFIAHGCCKKCTVKYKFVVKKKPNETDHFVRVQVYSSGPHEHDENEKNKQIRGEERERIAKEILVEAGGSCRNYYLQKREMGETPPNEATLRKIKSEFLNCTEITTHDWINELLSLTTTFKATIEAEKLMGYIQQITIFRDFGMHLYTEMQLQCLKCLPYKRRILHIDFMDSLVSIPKRFRNQSAILNYFLILKDTQDLGSLQQYDSFLATKSLLLGELSSSRYDIYGMCSFLKLIKNDYEYLYQLDEDKFSFRLICIEYSWNIINSCLETFNLETIEQYAQRVYNLSQGIDIEDTSKSWIYVCATHTMNKFCKSITKIIESDYIRLFACFCFSLLLNSYDLAICSQYFELICHVFLSRYSTQLSNSSFNKLQAAVHVRPMIKEEVIKLLNGYDMVDVKPNVSLNNGTTTPSSSSNGARNRPSTSTQISATNQKDASNLNDVLTNDEFELLNFKQIQDQLPFTLHFQTIFEKCFNIVKYESEKQTNFDQNVYYCPEFIQLLIENYLPYSFLWSAFVLRDIYNPNIGHVDTNASAASSSGASANNYNVTRLTNISVRKYSSSKKQKGLENVVCLPDKYANEAFKTVKSNCIEFLQQIGSAESDLVRIKISTSQLKYMNSTTTANGINTSTLNGTGLSLNTSQNDLNDLNNSSLLTSNSGGSISCIENDVSLNTSKNVNEKSRANSTTTTTITTTPSTKRKAASSKYKSPAKVKRLSASHQQQQQSQATSNNNSKSSPSILNKKRSMNTRQKEQNKSTTSGGDSSIDKTIDAIIETKQTPPPQPPQPVATSTQVIASNSLTAAASIIAATTTIDENNKSKDAQQYIEFIVKGIKITNQNIIDLLEGNATSDNVVEAFFNCISDKKTFVLSTKSTSELINGTFSGLKRNNLSKFKNIIGATNENLNGNWMLVYVSVSNASFSYINPLSHAINKEIEVFKYWKVFAEGRKEFASKSWTLKTYEYTQQNNVNMCGVLICKYAEMLLKNDSQNSLCFDMAQVSTIRQQIKDILQKHSDTDFCNYCGYVDCPCISLDMQVWLKCDKCDRRYHLFCATGSNSQQNRPEKFTCLFCDL